MDKDGSTYWETTGRDRRHLRVAWTPGSVQPYCSLWLTVHRFLLLNQPSRRTFEADFTLQASRGAQSLSLDCIKAGRQFRLLRFARVIGEPVDRFRWSTVGHYPQSLWPLFLPATRVCFRCMSESFHSVLYSLRGMDRCPVHDDDFGTICCCHYGYSEVGGLGTPFDRPGRCPRCSKAFLSAAVARDSKKNKRREEALQELTDWLQKAGSRAWFYLHDHWSSYPVMERFADHAQHWRQIERAPAPPATWLDPSRPRREEEWVCKSHEFGGPAVRLRRDLPSLSEHEAASAVFKSIKRYVVHHVLESEGRRWLPMFSKSSDAWYIQRHLESSSQAQLAWTLLLWWQSCVWSVGLRDWFRRQSFKDIPSWDVASKLNGSWRLPEEGSIQRGTPTSLASEIRGSARQWLNNWTTAGSLLILWWEAQRSMRRAVDFMEPIWGRGAVGGRMLPVWSAARDESGRLSLCMDSPAKRIWEAAPRHDGSERRRRTHEQAREWRVAVAETFKVPCLWFHSANYEWTSGQGPAIDDRSDIPRRRLLGETKTMFVLVSLQDCEATRRFAARCLALPVAASGETPKRAIQGLRMAVKHYLRSAPPDGSRDDVMISRGASAVPRSPGGK